MGTFSSPFPPGVLATSTGTMSFEPVSARAALVLLDGMESSFVDLDDPGHLEFEYMQQFDAAVHSVWGDGPVRALHLGGAACSLARAWAHTRPGSRQIVVEWDALIAELAREFCDIPRSPQVRIRVAEARASLEGFPAGRFDVVVRDTFAGGQVPDHLRTVQVARMARQVVSDGGLYCVNLTDHPPLTLARQEVATLATCFPYLALIADPAILRGRRYGNLVIIATSRPFDEADLIRRCRALPLPVRVVLGQELESFAGTSAILHDPLP